MGYAELYEGWKKDPESFWMKAAEAIDWVEKPSKALFDDNAPLYEWFSDAKVNTCWNAVDRHVEAGRGDQVAIIHDSPISGVTRRITYVNLRNRVAQLAGALRSKGVEKGDRVIIYMPMIPEALEAMLACSRLGAVHSVVFGGFAANELAVRIDDCTPKCIIAASCGLEPGRIVHYKPLLDGAIGSGQASSPISASSSSASKKLQNWRKGAITTGTAFNTASSLPNVCRLKATTRPISFIHLAPPAPPRALCATRRAIWWH